MGQGATAPKQLAPKHIHLTFFTSFATNITPECHKRVLTEKIFYSLRSHHYFCTLILKVVASPFIAMVSCMNTLSLQVTIALSLVVPNRRSLST